MKTYTIALKSGISRDNFSLVHPYQTYSKKNAAIAALKAYRLSHPTVRNAVLFSQWHDQANPNVPVAREYTVSVTVTATSEAEARGKVSVR